MLDISFCLLLSTPYNLCQIFQKPRVSFIPKKI